MKTKTCLYFKHFLMRPGLKFNPSSPAEISARAEILPQQQFKISRSVISCNIPQFNSVFNAVAMETEYSVPVRFVASLHGY